MRRISGTDADGQLRTVDLFDAASPAANPAFDITPAALVSGLVTELGPCVDDAKALAAIRTELEQLDSA